MTNFEKVREFHLVMGQPARAIPALETNPVVIKLRQDLIEEEFDELRDAVEESDIVEIADALTDLLYVIYGAGWIYGIDLDATFAEVHRSNMSKLGEDGKPIYREDGKIMKGPNFFKPNLVKVLEAQTETSGDEK